MNKFKPILMIDALQDVIKRAFKNIDYYKNNSMIKGTFDFLKLVVDSWYSRE